MSESKSTSPSILILIAVISCIGVLGAAFISILPDLLDRINTSETPALNYTPTNQSVTTDFMITSEPSATAIIVISSPTLFLNIECIRPETLASQKGWINPTLSDAIYGGYKVSLLIDSDLPEFWEANKYNNLDLKILEKQILENSTTRKMEKGVWVIYTPYDCRAGFGFYAK